jgi:hypothetical protein
MSAINSIRHIDKFNKIIGKFNENWKLDDKWKLDKKWKIDGFYRLALQILGNIGALSVVE